MRIVELHLNDLVLAKLAARGIRDNEVEQVLANRPYLAANPHPRVPTSRLLIGPTDGGRLITIVVQPDRLEPSLWHVMTGWGATRREILTFRRHA